MDNLIEAIQDAVAPNATEEMRIIGSQACRTILVALESKPGEPMAGPSQPVNTTDPTQLPAIIAGLRGVPVDQLLDLAISKLRTMVPADRAPQVRSIAIPLVPIAGRS